MILDMYFEKRIYMYGGKKRGNSVKNVRNKNLSIF